MNYILKSYTISKELHKWSVKLDLRILIDRAPCDACIFYQVLISELLHFGHPK